VYPIVEAKVKVTPFEISHVYNVSLLNTLDLEKSHLF